MLDAFVRPETMEWNLRASPGVVTAALQRLAVADRNLFDA
jgi:hypothetical protein